MAPRYPSRKDRTARAPVGAVTRRSVRALPGAGCG